MLFDQEIWREIRYSEIWTEKAPSSLDHNLFLKEVALIIFTKQMSVPKVTSDHILLSRKLYQCGVGFLSEVT